MLPPVGKPKPGVKTPQRATHKERFFMSKQKLLCLGLVSLIVSGSAYADDQETGAVLALMQQPFDAVGTGDPDHMRGIKLAEGTSLSFRPLAGGAPGELEMRMSSNEALAAVPVEDLHKYRERWTSEPTVMIRGPIAVVWGEYEFYIDGEFSHCGVDSVDLVKVDGVWKIANWMWTVEKEGCPTDPSQEKR